MSAFDKSYSESSSSGEAEWTSARKNTTKKKTTVSHAKKPRIDNLMSDQEEGEIESDAFEDDEDDGLDDNLYGDEEDKKRLMGMSEKEREEELYRRAERRDAIESRRAVKKRLKMQKEEVEKNNRVGKSPPSKNMTENNKTNKKPLTYAKVYGPDSEEEEADASNSSGTSIKSGLADRKSTLAKKKEANYQMFNVLAENRKALKEKREAIHSDSDDESSLSNQQAKRESKKKSKAIKIYPSSSSDSDSSVSFDETVKKPHRSPVSSRSSSGRSSTSSDDDRGRSRSPVEELVSSLDQLSKIRLSRHRLEKWVHMPFFDGLVKGCFARISIGLSHGVPVYRCGEITDVVETSKTYDLGTTRTNKGIILRVGKDQQTFRLAFVSNADFLPAEFESWLRRSSEANIRPPTLEFVSKKHAEIQKALNTLINDESVVEQIIQSKRRFQKAPTNFALRKAELMKQRDLADEEGDSVSVRRLGLELDELETQAERIDRRRTVGFKSITSINQRNRVLSVKQAEEAIIKESKENANSHEDDPFTRIQSKPVIVTKSYLEKLRIQRNLRNGADPNDIDICIKTDDSKLEESSDLISAQDSPISWSIPAPPEESLHAIHDFEIDIHVDMESMSDGNGLSESNISTVTSAQNPSAGARFRASPTANNVSEPVRRFTSLQEYKKRRGLI